MDAIKAEWKKEMIGEGYIVDMYKRWNEGFSGRIPQILKDYAQTHENTMLTLEPHLKAFAGLKDEVSIQYDEEAAYKDNNEAFDAGVAALKKILDEEGLSYE